MAKTKAVAKVGESYTARRIACSELGRPYEEYKGFAWCVFDATGKRVNTLLECFNPNGRAEQMARDEVCRADKAAKAKAAEERQRKAANKRAGEWLADATEADIKEVFRSGVLSGEVYLELILSLAVMVCDEQADTAMHRKEYGHMNKWGEDGHRIETLRLALNA